MAGVPFLVYKICSDFVTAPAPCVSAASLGGGGGGWGSSYVPSLNFNFK